MEDYHTGNLLKCHGVITGTVTWLITVPVMIWYKVSQCHYWYGNFANYRTGNDTKCHDVITGMVIWLITVPAII